MYKGFIKYFDDRFRLSGTEKNKNSKKVLTIRRNCDIVCLALRIAGVAQLVEQLICNQQVGGSSPSTSSTINDQLNTEEFPSGQRGQTVNLLQVASVVRIHPLPPKKNELLSTKSSFFFYPSRRLGISSAPTGLYIIHRFAMVYHHGIAVHKPSCGLMRCNTAC